jgi:predicted aspartyl protease
VKQSDGEIMKKIFLLYSIPIFLFTAIPLNAQPAARLIDSLYKEKNYFELRSVLQKYSELIPEYFNLKYGAVINNAFNNPTESNNDITKLFSDYKDKIDEKTKSELLQIKLYNEYKLYNYKDAAGTSELLINNFKPYFDSTEYEDLKNEHIIWNALIDSPPQKTIKYSTSEVEMKKDKASLLNVPALLNNQDFEFIFDTGANISVIRKSLAEKYKFKMLNANFYVNSFTGGKVESGLALADSLKIGNIFFQNVVFLVFPDEALTFPSANYSINGIIGYPVIEAMGEIKLTKEFILIIPENDFGSDHENLAIEYLMPIVSADVNGKKFVFTFDTGAQTSSLSSKYYEYLKTLNGEIYTMDSSHVGGAGSEVKIPSINLQNTSIAIGGKEITLDKLKVFTIPLREEDKYFYGNLGQDIISKFDALIINFKKMYLKFE